jgi:hypothetical protein
MLPPATYQRCAAAEPCKGFRRVAAAWRQACRRSLCQALCHAKLLNGLLGWPSSGPSVVAKARRSMLHLQIMALPKPKAVALWCRLGRYVTLGWQFAVQPRRAHLMVPCCPGQGS